MTSASPELDPVGYDPAAPEVRGDPYPAYTLLRRAEDPGFLSARGWWLLSRHAQVRAALRSPELFSSRVMRAADPVLLGSDPPRHTEVRHVVNSAFRQAGVADAWIREAAARLLERLPRQGRFDFVSAFAAELPVRVVARLLGVGEECTPDLKRWAGAFVPSQQPTGAQARRAVEELDAFLAELVARRRRDGADDVLSLLARQSSLDDAALCSVAKLLLAGGTETTAHLLGNTMLVLLQEPAWQQWALLGEQECGRLVEESLRYDAPVQLVLRETTRETTVGRRRLPAGARVALLLGSANRDEAVYSEPERFLPGRTAEPHLAFGAGPHACVGAWLSRREAVIGLCELFRRLRVRAAQDLGCVRRVSALQLRGPERLLLERV